LRRIETPGEAGVPESFTYNIMEKPMKHLAVVALLLVTATALAQETTLELLRSDLKTQKVAIITASLPLTQPQADLFWPIYREYSNELSKLGDRRLAVLKNFATAYDKIDEKTAENLVKESISVANDRNDLLEKYYKKVAKAVGVITAARFLQVENQILTLIDAQIINQVPLVKTGATGEQKK
jgi:hypothetical protein